MQIRLTVALPRDTVSIPVVRRMLTATLSTLRVRDDCARDVQLALTEACTNVLDHAEEQDSYEVSVAIDKDLCIIEVVDRGRGFDASEAGYANAATESEVGRGIQLMRAVADRVRFDDAPDRGTIVHLEKQLYWQDGAPLPAASDSGFAR